jgi:hypothetical protein
MATRKQRRRREKTFRHEYGFVVSDEEGNEVEVAGAELRSKKDPPAKEKSKQTAGKSRSRRAPRDPLPPSWNRALRRVAIWGVVAVGLAIVLFPRIAIPWRIVIGLIYAALLIPITYWMDSLVYRRFEKRKLAESTRPAKPR